MNVGDLVGIPYRLGGRGQGGIDCWGLVMEYFARRGVRLCDVEYDAEPTPEANAFESRRTAEWMPITDPQEGDVVLLSFFRHGAATHCGVYLAGGRVLHSVGGMSSVISPYRKLQRFVTAIYRHRGVASCPS